MANRRLLERKNGDLGTLGGERWATQDENGMKSWNFNQDATYHRLQIRNCVLRYKRVSYDTPGVHRTRKNALRRKCDEIEYLMCQDTRFVTRHESVSWDAACLRESI